MPTATVTVQTICPKKPWYPSDDALGELLVDLVARAVDAGGGVPAAIAVWPQEIQIIPLIPLIEGGWTPARFLASLSRTAHPHLQEPYAVGVIGRLRFRSAPDSPWVGIATVFVEWPDGRWWRWRQLLDADGARVAETAIWDRAVDGLPRPDHLGGYWRMGRLGQPPLQVASDDPRQPGPIIQ
jgi:hypothetical protein